MAESQDKDIKEWIQKMDIDQPESNPIPRTVTTAQLLELQSENQNNSMKELINCMEKLIIADKPEEVRTQLKTLSQRSQLVNKMIQERNEERSVKNTGSYFDPFRTPICAEPKEIATNTKSEVSDSALKLLSTFKGDGPEEAENLRLFLRSCFDVATTAGLNEECTKAILRRKLEGTARKIVDSYVDEFEDPKKVTLRAIILKLEDRFMATLSPELANAKLSMLKKTGTMTFSQLEGHIAELTTLAARGEIADKPIWIKQRRIEVFKQSINEEDRLLVARENQSRNLNGLGELNLSQGIDFLIKHHCEKDAFSQVQTVMTTGVSEEDSILTVKDKKKNGKQEKGKGAKKAEEDQKIKDELFQMFEERRKAQSQNQGKRGRGSFRGRSRGGRRGGRGRGDYNNGGNGQRYNNGGNGQGWKQNGKQNKKYITHEMVNCDPNGCLACNSQTHRFYQRALCAYGAGTLMDKPCGNCGVGGHHMSLCLKDQKSNLGAQQPMQQQYGQFTNWQEAKAAQEAYQRQEPQLLPNIFPN